MSQPIRYGLADEHLGRIHPQEDGHLVMWSDYAAVVEAGRRADLLMANLHMEYRRLAAENERLAEDNRQLTKVLKIAEGIIKRMGKVAEDAAKEGGAK